MEDKDFAEAMRRMVGKHGKEALLGDKAKGFINDYRGQFYTEANIFIKMLEAGCAKFINEAGNILECKRQLVKRLEDEEYISRKFSMPMLDLLGYLIKGDGSKCMEQPGDDLKDKAEAAWVLKDYKEAENYYRKAADMGNAEAQFDLAWYYYSVKGPAQDYAKAAEWYRKAAEQGHYKSQFNLGYCYANGLGVPKSEKETEYWYRRAAEQGDAYAQYWLGRLYSDSNSLCNNLDEAFKWFLKAAEQGHAQAQSVVGFYYENGLANVKEDYAEAAKWYRKAEHEDHRAKEQLDKLKSEGKI